MTNSEIIVALDALSEAGVHGEYQPNTHCIYATMQFPDPDTNDVYTEETPLYSLGDVYDLLGQ